MNRFAPLALLLVVAVSLSGARPARAQQSADRLLPGCGICYPGGYDVNTVGVVTGTILELQEPAEGPVRLVLAGEHERWIALGSPAWFWRQAGLRFKPGDVIAIRGSKTLGADGSMYLIAREIRSPRSAAAAVLRDQCGLPLWGSRHRERQLPEGAARDGRGTGPGSRRR